VKHLIAFTQISYTAIWVVQKAIDIYTEKPDGSIKQSGWLSPDKRGKQSKIHKAASNGLTRYREKIRL
jgi:hypothetical protein